MRIHLVSLGCARNLVDSEEMLGRLEAAGWDATDNPADAHAIVVNTCSFIEPAVDESVDTILEMARYKKTGICRRLIVAGCLPERYRDEIVATLPEVDQFLGTGAFDRIIEAAEGPIVTEDGTGCLLPDPDRIDVAKGSERRRLTTGPFAYLKIAEGCSRRCTYCIIPKLRGRQKSLPAARLVNQAKGLIASGARELVLVAQDTTAYGSDASPPADLSGLMTAVADIDETVWVRALYGHPESMTAEMIATFGSRPNICPYFDIPIQHASTGVLKRMGRHYSPADLYGLFEDIRTRVAGAALRTTIIVGFPGESDDDFEELLKFVADIRFDHLGAFVYSDAEDLPSHRLGPHIPAKTAQQRHDRLMEIQADISLENNRRYLGRTLDVLVETPVSGGSYKGRTMFQAPEVDGVTFIRIGSNQGQLSPGEIVRVKITDAQDYDLTGDAI